MAERAAEPLQIFSELLLCDTISIQNSITIYIKVLLLEVPYI